MCVTVSVIDQGIYVMHMSEVVGQIRFKGASVHPLVSQMLTGASVLVGHVDVNVRG